MPKPQHKLWFRHKRYGWGWTPVTWQGWLVLLIYLLGVIYLFSQIDSVSHSASDTLIGLGLPVLAWTSLLMVICYLTGERPGWHWGK